MPASPQSSRPLVYVSYSAEDKRWLDRLLRHLEPLRSQRQLDIWYDRELSPGRSWVEEFAANLDRARVAIVLLSPAYQASEHLAGRELPALVSRQGPGLQLFTLFVEPVPLEGLPWFQEEGHAVVGLQPLSEYPESAAEDLLRRFAHLVVETVERQSQQADPEPVEKGEPPSEPPPPPAEEPAPAPPPTSHDRVPTHSDDPSEIDLLNRRPFAEVISIRIGELRHPAGPDGEEAQGDEGSFAVHLYGPWGAGKTSVLHFIREELVSGGRGAEWIAVVFNAWQHQRLRPPWWSLIRQVYLQSREQLDAMAAEKPEWESSDEDEPTREEVAEHRFRRRKLRRTARRLRWRWFVWRLRADLMPALVALVLLALVLVIMRGKVDTGLKVAATLLAAGAGALTFGRSLLFGSAKAAESYLSISRDPMSPIGRLFEKLVEAFSDYPLVVFIDDLDRCDSDYVVELLEGIQTLFRRAPVTYVVLADRKWIRSSFEQRYEGFSGVIAEPGRPLGYLFLEKMFQISAPLPRLSGGTRSEFWDQLLDVSAIDGEEELLEAAAEAVKKAEGFLPAELNQEQIEQVIEEHRTDPLLVKGLRTVAAKRMSSPAQQRQTAHFLQPFAPLLEPNPRAMKRLVNAYGIYQAVNFLEGRRVDRGALALWCILEMRWPLLAECLADTPSLVAEVGKPKSKDGPVPKELCDLFASEKVGRVVDPKTADRKLDEENRVNVDAKLTVAEIRRIVGSWAEVQQLAAETTPPPP